MRATARATFELATCWQTDGPIVRRQCVETPRGFALLETPTSGGPLDGVTQSMTGRIAAWRPRLEIACDAMRFPDAEMQSETGTLEYDVPSPRLLGTVLMESDAPPGVFRELGRCLATIHSIVDLETGRASPAVDALSAGPGSDGARADLQAALSRSELMTLAGAAQTDRAHVFLHGRWSIGSVFLGEPGWTVLSGVEFWHGPAEHDIAYMLGEMVEMATHAALAGALAPIRRGMDAALELVSSYRNLRSLDLDRVINWTAHRIVSHLMWNCCWRQANGVQQPSRQEWSEVVAALAATVNQLKRQLR